MDSKIPETPIRKGVFWSLAGQLAGRAINFASMLVLARLLTPADYGLFGLANSAVAFASLLGDLGLGAAFIQRQGNERANASAAFYLNAGVVFSAGVVLASLAPWVARYYGQPALQGILFAVVAGFVFRGSAAIHEAYLRKTMRYRHLQAVHLASTALYVLVSVVLAWRGFGPWSLAIGSAMSGLVVGGLMWLTSPLPLSLRLHRERWRDLLGFGRYVLLASLLWFVVMNGDNLAVGKVLGTSALGFYAVAYNYGRLPQMLAGNAVEDVLFSAFSRAQADPDQLRTWLVRSVSLMALVAVPTSALMCVTGHDLMVGALGKRWAPAGLPFTVFSSAFSLLMIAGPFAPLYRALNRPQLHFYIALVTVPVFLLAVAAGLRFGFVGVAVGVASTMLIVTFIQIPLVASLVGERSSKLLGGLVAPLICAIMALGIALLGRHFFWSSVVPIARFAISTAVFVLIYGGLLRLLHPERWNQLRQFVRLRSFQ